MNNLIFLLFHEGVCQHNENEVYFVFNCNADWKFEKGHPYTEGLKKRKKWKKNFLTQNIISLL